MSDVEMRDIGLVRQDAIDESMLRFDAERLVPLMRQRERPSPGRWDLAA